jgi:ABC-type multidrug transport system ATPase subunit
MVEIEELTVEFPRGWRQKPTTAVDHLTLTIGDGEFCALLGPNGSGKSTTIYCTLGLLRPTSGSVRVFGETLTPGCPRLRDVAYLPEEPHYHDYLTVEEAVRYYAGLYGVRPAASAIDAVLERLNLGSARSVRIASCSKGMKQKVGIAQCLLHQPRLLLLDEPMRGLDPVAVKEFRDVLLDLNRHGATVVMSSHMLAEVELMATRAAVLANGRLVASGDVATLLGAGDEAGRPQPSRLENWMVSTLKDGSDPHA